MKQISIRKKGADYLFKYIAEFYFQENEIDVVETDDNSVNPLVILKTNKWELLIKALDEFISEHSPSTYTDDISEMELVAGTFNCLKHHIEMEMRHKGGE